MTVIRSYRIFSTGIVGTVRTIEVVLLMALFGFQLLHKKSSEKEGFIVYSWGYPISTLPLNHFSICY